MPTPPESSEAGRLVPRGVVWPFVLLTSLFAWWGLANNMTDTLLAAFKRIKSMSDSETALIQVVCYGLGYGAMAIPAAILVRKYSYKFGVILGLALYATGALLFYPAMLSLEYYAFLGAIWVLFTGLTVLEAAANPYVLAIGPEETATRRLNFAQSFNPAGSILGVALSEWFILRGLNTASATERAAMPADELEAINLAELQALIGPYLGIGVLMIVMMLLIGFTPMPRVGDASPDINLKKSFGRLLGNSTYVGGVVAQFFYVGAQIGVWSFTIRYVMQELQLESIALPEGQTPESYAAGYYRAAIVLFLLSRFVCTGAMRFLSPARLLTLLASVAVGLMLVAITAGGLLGVYALVGVSGCMSLMFPTIFGLSAVGLGEDTKLAGAGQIMAIAGGAAFTQVQGLISDSTGSIKQSFWIPLAAFGFVAVYGYFQCRASGSRTPQSVDI